MAEARKMSSVDNKMDSQRTRAVSPNGHDSAAAKVIRKIMRKAMGGTEIGITNALEGTEFDANAQSFLGEGESEIQALELVDRYWPKAGKRPIGIKKKEPADIFKPSSFIKTAGMSTFSVCFNDRGQDGALSFGSVKSENA